MAEWGIERTFLYLPISPTVVARHEQPLGYIHWTLSAFFWPVWELDHVVTGMHPIQSMPMLEMSSPNETQEHPTKRSFH
jgi:hypothetical protein